MSEKHLDEFPAEVREQMPQGAQQIFAAAYNSASGNGMDEDAAMRVAWNSVKDQYQQGADGKWHKKPDEPGIHYKPITSGGN